MTPAGKTPGMTRKLLALSFSIALATSGIGMILPIVPFHIERVGLGGMPTAQVAVHVSLLAASYALMQLVLAPVWGRLSAPKKSGDSSSSVRCDAKTPAPPPS